MVNIMNRNYSSKPTKTFQPRPSLGWAWLVLMAVVIMALTIIPTLATGLSSSSAHADHLYPCCFCLPDPCHMVPDHAL